MCQGVVGYSDAEGLGSGLVALIAWAATPLLAARVLSSNLPNKPAATLAYRPFRPVAPVFRALPATKLVAKANNQGARAEGAPTGGGRADQRAGLMPRSGEAQGRAGAHTTCLAAGH